MGTNEFILRKDSRVPFVLVSGFCSDILSSCSVIPAFLQTALMYLVKVVSAVIAALGSSSLIHLYCRWVAHSNGNMLTRFLLGHIYIDAICIACLTCASVSHAQKVAYTLARE